MKGCELMSLNGGYAMIKYNSTQEELQIAYRSKKPALFYDENQRAHWAVIEETATQSVDEETQEPITLYEYSYRLLDEESGGSEKLYHHNITIEGKVGYAPNCYFDIYTRDNTPFTTSLICDYISKYGKINPLSTPYCFNNTIKYLNYLRLANSYPTNRLYADCYIMTLTDGNFRLSTEAYNVDSSSVTDMVTEV